MALVFARFLLFALISAAPSRALAHTGVGDTYGFIHGVSHPFFGLDHVIVMIGIGVFAAHLGGRALWIIPLGFLVMVGIGGVLGMDDQLTVPSVDVEIMIGLSIIALGLAIALEMSLPTVVALGLAGLFALVHGYAHGSEMPESGSGLEYGAGFLLGTAILQLIGIGIGLVLRFNRQESRILKFGGGLMALVGLAFVTRFL